jgi:hypothetical protein
VHNKSWLKKQSLCDSSNMPIGDQNSILKLLFGDVEETSSDASGGLANYTEYSIGRLLTALPKDWKGELGGVEFPKSFHQFNRLYTKMGMVKPVRYRLCTGNADNPHEPILLQPSTEEFREGPCRVFCSTDRHLLRIDCNHCCSTCTECGAKRRDILAFDLP